MYYDCGHTGSESGVFIGSDGDGVAADVLPGLEEIHRSGVSVLFRACIDGRRVVLKGLPEEKRADPGALAALRKEYMMLMELDHPGIVRVFRMADIPPVGPAIVMEYIDGDTLADMDAVGLPVAERRRLMKEITEAVAYIHSKGIVHRDLKPANVMVTRLGRHARLIDFGLADSDGWWLGKQPAGTEGYVSGEQRSSRVPDPRNDVYSLGVMIGEMRPGWIYGRVLRRCVGPAGRRYGSAGTLLHRLRRVRRNYMLTLCGLATVVAIAAVLLVLPRPEETALTDTYETHGGERSGKMVPAQETEVFPASETAATPTEEKPDEVSGMERPTMEERRGGEFMENDVGTLPKELILEAYKVLDAPLKEYLAEIESAASPNEIPYMFNPARTASQAEVFYELKAPSLSESQKRMLQEILKQRIIQNRFTWEKARERKLKELTGEEM